MKDKFITIGIITIAVLIGFWAMACDGSDTSRDALSSGDELVTGGQGALPVDDYPGVWLPGVDTPISQPWPVSPLPIEDPKLDGTELSYNDFLYTVSDFITIAGYTGSGDSVSIPAEIDGKPVAIIGPGAFIEKQLIDVSIPASVTSIASKAFYGNLLTSITLGNDVIFVGVLAFVGNPLTSVTIGANVRFDQYSFGSEGLLEAYIRNGRRAGTYTRPDIDSESWIHN